MKSRQNLLPQIVSLGVYKSPKGGSRRPFIVPPGNILFEIIQDGIVYGFEPERVLRGQGSVFCHYPGQPTVSDSPDHSFYNCAVALFACTPAERAARAWPRCFQWKNQPQMHRFLGEMLVDFHRGTVNRLWVGNLLWSRLRLELERFRLQEKMSQMHPRLRAAADYMDTHFSAPVSLDGVARACSMSVSHMHALFQKHFGESPHQYLIQKRLRAAGHLLATTNLPIKAVANEVGYANVENFCRAFGKYFGRTASDYRQAYTTER